MKKIKLIIRILVLLSIVFVAYLLSSLSPLNRGPRADKNDVNLYGAPRKIKEIVDRAVMHEYDHGYWPLRAELEKGGTDFHSPFWEYTLSSVFDRFYAVTFAVKEGYSVKGEKGMVSKPVTLCQFM